MLCPLPARPARSVAAVVLAVVAVLAAVACDASQSARTGPADELDDGERPYAAPLGALFVQDIPDGLRGTFDAECVGAAYIRGFGLDALVAPGADAASLTAEDLVQEAPADVDADSFIESIRACGDVRVYAALIGGTRWARSPLTAEQLRCAAGRMDEARAARLLRTSIVVEDEVDEATRDDATREIVGHLTACGAAMTVLP